jgi:hypothetical protein
MNSRFRLLFVLPLLAVLPAMSQSSSVLKKATNYLPSLSEIGFVTGAINCYVQTATLVRTVNKEIALAKSMSRRLDDLKGETEQLLGRFGTLSEINPYDMDSWAAWLDRADGLVTEETNDFVDVLFNSVLKTLDDRMTVGFYSEVRRGLSYDASQGRVTEVLRAYYLNRTYEDSREKIRTVALNTRRIVLLGKQAQLAMVQYQLIKVTDPDTRAALEQKAKKFGEDIRKLESEIQDPAVGGTSTDRQIAFLMDMAQTLGEDIGTASQQLEQHQKDLLALNSEWDLAAKDKLPKAKNRSIQSQPVTMDRDLYHPTNADKVPTPTNDVDRPAKQNTSETATPTTLSDLLQLQNKIEFKKLEMMEGALNMELQLAQSRSILLAITAYKIEDQRNRRTDVIFEAENLEHAIQVRGRK